MARNPTWSRDELILALDLYLRHRERLPDSDDAEIVELSHTLNSLFGERANDAALFRNRNGVYMKLANFRSVDPLHTSQGKRGLSRGGNGVAELWEEFSNRGDELKLIASAIRAAAGDQGSSAVAVEDEGIADNLLRHQFTSAFARTNPRSRCAGNSREANTADTRRSRSSPVADQRGLPLSGGRSAGGRLDGRSVGWIGDPY
jgi:hypothetical protein